MIYRKLIIRAIFAIIVIFIIALGITWLMDRNKEHNTGYVRGDKITLSDVNMSSRWEINGVGRRHPPGNLIDGLPSTIVTTDGQPDNDLPWVSARISGNHRIGDVLLTNRPHVGYQRFLGNFGVWLSNRAGDTTSINAKHCGDYTTGTDSSGPFTVNCDGKRGNWVTVKQIYGPANSYYNNMRYLTPSELEVYVAEPSTTTVTGCMRQGATNFNPDATVEGNCTAPRGTVWDNQSGRYMCRPNTGRIHSVGTDSENATGIPISNPLEDTERGNCGPIYGCMDAAADNFNPAAEIGLAIDACTYSGCTDSTATNYDSRASVNDNSCTYSNTDTNFGRPLNDQAEYDGVNINGCLVATDTSSCTGVKINVIRNVTNNENGASRTLVRHLCCDTLAQARNAETTLNSAHRTARTTVGGYRSVEGQTYNNSTSVFF